MRNRRASCSRATSGPGRRRVVSMASDAAAIAALRSRACAIGLERSWSSMCYCGEPVGFCQRPTWALDAIARAGKNTPIGSTGGHMPLPSDIDATSPKFLRDKYAIVGIGETDYMRGSGRTTRALATWAVRNAIEDAGLKSADIDGMLSYQSGDSVFAPFVAGDLGIRLNFYMDVFGGGSSTEALVGIAMGVIEAGLCRTVVIFRSMNGYSQVRIGGTGVRSAAPVSGDILPRRADVQPDLHAPHARLRHPAGAGRGRQGDPQRARVEQSQGALQTALHGCGRAQEPHQDR